MHAATRMVGQGAHGGDVGAGEKRHAVFGAQALAGKDLVQDVGKPEACVIGSIQHNGYPQMMIGRSRNSAIYVPASLPVKLLCRIKQREVSRGGEHDAGPFALSQ